ncbi:MAG: MBL fold metallo-hydrolase [Mogibacterium sp.]|nr:MBL fold metallo-hydrolase [Mogibacterium sp.]
MKIQFCGATTGVTGSCHLLQTDKYKVLLDCGQFQGGKSQDALNYEDFPFEPSEINCLVLSHAHIDHCGRIPLLVKRGFHGPVYCTKATADLLPIMLRDSAYIHEKEAEWANKKGQRKGEKPVEPLYTVDDAERALALITPIQYDQKIDINDEIRICYDEAGHILGSAITELWVRESDGETKIVFSGDIGVMDRPILRDPTFIESADYIIMESTYGDRLHPQNAMSIQQLVDVVLRTVRRGGTVVIPAFAVGRTQEMIYEFNKLYDEHPEEYQELKDIMVYVDSPMASRATEVFKENASVFDEKTQEYLVRGDHPLEFRNLIFTQSTEESQRLNEDDHPKVIISASGMCEAGRIKHHLKHHLWNPKSTIVFVGYQAEGTLGRHLIEGAESVNLFGEEVMVKAEIVNLEGFSGHADMNGLLDWAEAFKTDPTFFLVHGEEQSKKNLAKLLRDRGATVIVIEENSEFELKPGEKLSSSETTVGGDSLAFDYGLSKDELHMLRNKISEIESEIGDVLSSAELATGKKISQDKLVRINNIIQDLDSSIKELRSVLVQE